MIHHYSILRSISNHLLFDVIAFSKDHEPLHAVEIDMEFDQAVELYEALCNIAEEQ